MNGHLDWLADDTVIETVREASALGLRPEPGPWTPDGALPLAWLAWLATCRTLEWIGLADTLGFVGTLDDVLGHGNVRRALAGRAIQQPIVVDLQFAARREATTSMTAPDASWGRRHRRNLKHAARGDAPSDTEALWLVHGTAGHLAAACAAQQAWSPHGIRAAVLRPRATTIRTLEIASVALEALAAADDNERAFEAARSWRDVHLDRRERIAGWLESDIEAPGEPDFAAATGRPGTARIHLLEVQWSRPPVDGEDPDRPILETARVIDIETRVERAGVDLVERWLRCFGEWRGTVRDDVLARVRPTAS